MLIKQDFYENNVWPRWIHEFQNANHRTILLHGIMGSELYDKKNDETVWLDSGIFHEMDNLEYDTLSPNGARDVYDQFIYARSTVHPPVIKDPYSALLETLSLGRFNYDWRESLPIEACRLSKFLKKIIEGGNKISFVTHSMGGCLLLWLLGGTPELNKFIDKIIFCAPPFHGALKPIRVIEQGNGTPISLLVYNSTIRKSCATLPGLFELLVAPEEDWIKEITLPNGNKIKLKYPVLGDKNLYNSDAWLNRERLDLRVKILDIAKRYHQEMSSRMQKFVEYYSSKTNVIVGLNGKTACLASYGDIGGWRLHKVPNIKNQNGKISNGDGTVLFQSSIIPGLPTERYWALIPEKQKNVHGGIVDQEEVIKGIDEILKNKKPTRLINYNDFIDKIEWDKELVGMEDPGLLDSLDHLERAHMRNYIPRKKWGKKLNPRGKDTTLFHTTRQAAVQVSQGKDIKEEAKRIGESFEFLNQHVQNLLMPLLY